MGKENRQITRNSTIDIIKGFACIAVVLIHYNWSNDIGVFVKTLARFAVPFFFFVSGYYLPNREGMVTSDNVKRKMVHIIDIAWKSGVFYLFFCVLWNSMYYKNWSLAEYTDSKISVASCIKFILGNDPFVYDHFWYILALLYSYATVYVYSLFRQTIKKPCILLILSVFLMLGFSVLDEFNSYFHIKNAWHLDSEGSRFILSNTFLFRALPFFLFGMFVKLDSGNWNRKISLTILCGFNFMGILLALYEATMIKSVQFYLGSYISVISLILISIWYPHQELRFVEFIGNKLSMNVYLYHIAVGKIFDLIAQKNNLWNNSLFMMTRPFLIVTTSLLISYLLVDKKYSIFTKIKNHRNHEKV